MRERGLEEWEGRGGKEDPSFWSWAHLLIQAELREGQKQHQTQRGPTNGRQGGDSRWEPQVVLGHCPQPSRLPTS